MGASSNFGPFPPVGQSAMLLIESTMEGEGGEGGVRRHGGCGGRGVVGDGRKGMEQYMVEWDGGAEENEEGRCGDGEMGREERGHVRAGWGAGEEAKGQARVYTHIHAGMRCTSAGRMGFLALRTGGFL